MERLLLCAEHFLDQSLRDRIGETARSLGFTPRFLRNGRESGEDIRDYEILFGLGFEKNLRQADSLRWYCCPFAGVENYGDPALWPDHPCLFTNSAGAYGLTISEHVVMVLLMLLRRMPEYQRDLARREWTLHAPIRSIHGLRVTILGTGDIGIHTARSLGAMGALVRGVRRNPDKPADPAFREIWAAADLDRLLPETDALILALPSTAATRGILSRERLALLPADAYVVNVGRGTAIDQEALANALNSGRLAGAALDVMVPEPLPAGHPLWETKNLLLTPHCSGNTSLAYSREKIAAMFLEDLARYAAGEPLLHLVDRREGY